MRLQRDLLLNVPWGYAILDEGHKIRNPDAEVCMLAQLAYKRGASVPKSDKCRCGRCFCHQKPYDLQCCRVHSACSHTRVS